MWKVAIFDDNQTVLDSLRFSIDWAAMHCTICGIAANGEEAKRILWQTTPDIVISDIMMPAISGLDLARFCQEQRLTAKFIMITGFSNTDYARQSVRLHVFDYISKPLDNDEIRQVVTEAIYAIKRERSGDENLPKAPDPVATVLDSVYSRLGSYSPLIVGIIRYIGENYEREIYLKTVANEFFVSPSYLSSKFKEETNVGFIKFVTLVKLSNAKVLLRDPRNNISDVARRVGYHDYAYFYQVFKKYYGYAPGAATAYE